MQLASSNSAGLIRLRFESETVQIRFQRYSYEWVRRDPDIIGWITTHVPRTVRNPNEFLVTAFTVTTTLTVTGSDFENIFAGRAISRVGATERRIRTHCNNRNHGIGRFSYIAYLRPMKTFYSAIAFFFFFIPKYILDSRYSREVGLFGDVNRTGQLSSRNET